MMLYGMAVYTTRERQDRPQKGRVLLFPFAPTPETPGQPDA